MVGNLTPLCFIFTSGFNCLLMITKVVTPLYFPFPLYYLVFIVGREVWAFWNRGHTLYKGRITAVSEDGLRFNIHYDDGDIENNVERARITDSTPIDSTIKATTGSDGRRTTRRCTLNYTHSQPSVETTRWYHITHNGEAMYICANCNAERSRRLLAECYSKRRK
jgi:hypothetical protein